MPKTNNAKHVANHRARKRKQGFVPIELWLLEKNKAAEKKAINELLEKMRK